LILIFVNFILDLVAFTMGRCNPFPPWEMWFFTCSCRWNRWAL